MNTNQVKNRLKESSQDSAPSWGILALIVLGTIAEGGFVCWWACTLSDSWIKTAFYVCLGVSVVVAGSIGSVVAAKEIRVHWDLRRWTRIVGGVALCAIGIASSILAGSSIHADTDDKAARERDGYGKIAGMSELHYEAVRTARVASKSGTGARRAALDAQRADLVKVRDKFREDGVVTKGVLPTQAKIESVDAEILKAAEADAKEESAFSKESSAAELARLGKLDGALAEAKADIQKSMETKNGFSGFSKSLGMFGVAEGNARRSIYIGIPTVASVLVLLASFLYAGELGDLRAAAVRPVPVPYSGVSPFTPFTPANGYRQNYSAPRRTPEGRPPAVLAEAIREPQMASHGFAEPEPEPEPEPERRGKMTLSEYARHAMESWTPEDQRLVAKNAIQRDHSLGAADSAGLHRRLVRTGHVFTKATGPVRGTYTNWSDPPPTREAALARLLA